MSSDTLFKYLKSYKEYKCEQCNIFDTWNNKPLRLQIDHIKGINSDNSLDNLRFLCANCHSQSDTFTGRNAKTRLNNKPTREEFLALYSKYKLNEISISRKVSLRCTYQWFNEYVRDWTGLPKEKLIRKDKPSRLRRLTKETVLFIYNSKLKNTELAKIHNISERSIRNIKHKDYYKDWLTNE